MTWPIGFHLGAGGGNPTGIGAYIRALDAAGIPAAVKCTDGMVGLFDAQEAARASGVPHDLVFRRSGIGSYDTPNYAISPATAAAAHWALHKAALPPELDRQLTWIETINEPDKTRARWLAEFALATARAMVADGYRYLAFGCAAGTPEPVDWTTPEMLAFLRYAAERPDRVGIAVHEYSYQDNQLMGDGRLIGRYTDILDACETAGIAYPTLMITEFGWTHERVPVPEVALPQLVEMANLYAWDPQVRAAYLWYLGPGYAGIADRTQQLIAPVTQAALAFQTPVPPPAPPPAQYRKRLHLLPQDAVPDEVEHVLVNDGALARRESFLFSVDDAEGVLGLPTTRPDSEVLIWSPERFAEPVEARLLRAAGQPPRFRVTARAFEMPASMTYWPAQTRTITQRFKANPGNYPDLPGHDGLDLAVAKGLPFFAAAAGRVVHASDRRWSTPTASNYGWHVVLEHAGGLATVYGHAQPDLPVSVGDQVAAGAVVGYSGNTGQTTGYHLHFGLLDQTGERDPANGFPEWKHGRAIDPLPWLEGLPLPPEPPVRRIDLLPYVKGDGRVYQVKSLINGHEGHETFQTQNAGTRFYQVKNNQWEELWAADGYIWRGLDTSPGNGRYYALHDYGPTGPVGSRWCRQQMAVGERFQRQPWVQFYRKADCARQAENSGPTSDWILMAAAYPSYTFLTGVTVVDVVELQWLSGAGTLLERYFYARDLGLVGWQGGAGWSAVESLGGDPPARERIGCLS